MNRYRCFNLFIGCMLISAALPVEAQPPQAPIPDVVGQAIEPNHAELYFSFLRTTISAKADMANRSAFSAEKAEDFVRNRSAQLGLSRAEFDLVDRQAAAFDETVIALNADIAKVLSDAKEAKKEPDQAKLRAFEDRRYLAIAATMFKIQRELPRSAWANLLTYINHHHRFSVRSISSAAK